MCCVRVCWKPYRLPSRVLHLDPNLPGRARTRGAEQLLLESLGVRALAQLLCFEVAFGVDGLLFIHIEAQVQEWHAGVLPDLRFVLEFFLRGPQ